MECIVRSALVTPGTLSDVLKVYIFKSKIMNEIVPESPERESDQDDENDSYVPETPQKDGSPQMCRIIPIPSFTRIRKSLGVLDNNTGVLSPMNRECLKYPSPISSKKSSKSKSSRKKDKLDSLDKIKISLFHNKEKENQSTEKSFTVNPKSFYGSSEQTQDLYVLAPDTITPPKRRNSGKKKSPPSNGSTHKQSLRKHKKGEINCGVAHGIKKPRRKRSSLNDDSMESEKQINLSVESNNQNDSIQENNQTKEYDSSRKFFKYKHGHRLITDISKITKSPMSVNSCKKDSPISEPVRKKLRLSSAVNSHEKNNLESVTKKSCLANVIQDQEEDSYLKCSENINKSYTNSKKATDVPEKLESEKESKDIEMNTCNNMEFEETVFPLKNQKDIDDLLRVLEEDWSDDTEIEDNLYNTIHISPLKESNDTVSDAVMNFSAECNKEKTMLNSDQTMNFVDLSNTFKNKTEETEQADQKYYSLFYKKWSSNTIFEESNLKKRKNTAGQWKYNNDKNQYQIDAGQKIFGVVQCKECNLPYHVGDKGDEATHLKYHNSFQMLKFQGWKTERVVFNDSTTMSRIILVKPSDANIYHQKVMEILEVINQDLGLCDIKSSNFKDKQTYLYIRNKTVLGVMLAESIYKAFTMIPEFTVSNCCTLNYSCVKCGINILWTAKSHRRQGIATKLVDILRMTYCYGYVIPIDEIAFSLPTESGKLFAESYTKTKNFKVY